MPYASMADNNPLVACFNFLSSKKLIWRHRARRHSPFQDFFLKNLIYALLNLNLCPVTVQDHPCCGQAASV